MFKKIVLAAAAIIILSGIIIFFFVSSKSPIDPVAYLAPEKPEMTGMLAPNTFLQNAELLAKGKISGPEEVAVDNQGRVYFGTPNGKILRLLPGGLIELFTTTGGRPLGMKFGPDGNLIVADGQKGLLSVDPRGSITNLAHSAEHVPFKCADALDIAKDGKIYFTDASFKYPPKDFMLDLLEARPHGRLMRYDPTTKTVTVLMRDLNYANGVALSQDENFVLVNETFQYRVHRYWLDGPRAGTSDIFIDNLPGFPDNISSNGKGKFWLALFTVRNSLLDTTHKYPIIKSFMAGLPQSLWPKAKRYGFVIALDERGNITESLQDPTGEHLYDITSAQEYAGYLYLGSFHADRIGKLKVGE